MKKFTHNQIEKCLITKKDIDTKKDRYCILVDCEGDNITNIGFYKTDILKDLLFEKGERLKKIMISDAMGQARTMMENVGVLPKVYDVGIDAPKYEREL